MSDSAGSNSAFGGVAEYPGFLEKRSQQTFSLVLFFYQKQLGGKRSRCTKLKYYVAVSREHHKVSQKDHQDDLECSSFGG